MSAMADTGCQSCLTGIKVIQQLGLHQSDLIPVSMRMHAANNQGIEILVLSPNSLLHPDGAVINLLTHCSAR